MAIRQILRIGSGDNSIETTEGYNFSGAFDIDELHGILTFSLPYLLPGQKNVSEQDIDLTRLKKYDTVQLYFREYGEGEVVPNTTIPEDLDLIFYGFIKSIKLAKGKDSIPYEIEAHGTLGLAEERTLVFERKEGELQNLLVGSTLGTELNPDDIGVLQLAFSSQTNEIIPRVEFRDVDANTLFVKINSAKNLKDVLSNIKENYALIIHQLGDGTLLVLTPFYLLSAREDDFLNVNSWSFELGTNAYELDYGDLTNNINSVVVLGFYPHFGMAVDPVMVQLNAGAGNTPGPESYNYLTFENRDITSDEDCQKVARQKLLEITRNYAIKFRTKFDPAMHIGQPFTINDNDRFTTNQVWIIKTLEWTISKDDVSAQITGYANSLDTFPEDIVISNTGIADVDALEIREKLDDQLVNWNGNFS